MQGEYGNNLKLTIFGASHDSHIGMRMEQIPAGLAVDLAALQAFLDRRAPGKTPGSTTRKERDIPHFLHGLQDANTTGETIEAILYNEYMKRSDYDALQAIPRPGHADFTAWMKYGLDFDMSGGGPFSGRLTAPLCVAGGLCKQWLEAKGIFVQSQILQVGSVRRGACDDFDDAMQQEILQAQQHGDSVGGRIGCTVTGIPLGLGGPMFAGVESHLSRILFAIPAVKAVGFGSGHDFAGLTGSQANDAFFLEDGRVKTVTNHCGGILGGITNGMPLVFDVTIKPTPSISLPQKSVHLKTMEEVTVQIQGRHDSCILPRALPVVEAAAAIAIYDLILGG